MYGQTRRRLQRLAARVRDTGDRELPRDKIASALFAILALDVKLIQQEMDRVRAGGDVKPDHSPVAHNPDLDALIQ